MYAGGLREACVCDVLLRGFGASVLVFFGERGPVAVGHDGGPECLDFFLLKFSGVYFFSVMALKTHSSGMGYLGDMWLGTWRSVRAGLGGLLGADPSV